MVKTAYVVYGRMNPPTKGHQKLIEKARNLAAANKAPLIVYTTYTHNSNTNPRKTVLKGENKGKNPLPPRMIMSTLRMAFKGNMVLKSLPKDSFYNKTTGPLNVRTTKATGGRAQSTRASVANRVPYPHKIFHDLHKQGYERAVLVLGSDRVPKFTKMLSGIKFINVDVVSAGNRDPDSNGINGISATKAREAAIMGNRRTFRNMILNKITNKRKNVIAKTIVKKTSPSTKNSIRRKHFNKTPGKGGSVPTPDILGSIRRNLTPRRTL